MVVELQRSVLQECSYVVMLQECTFFRDIFLLAMYSMPERVV